MNTLFINIGFIESTILIVILVATLISALYLIINNEKGATRILWMFFVFIAPILGPIVYIISYFLSGVNKKIIISSRK